MSRKYWRIVEDHRTYRQVYRVNFIVTCIFISLWGPILLFSMLVYLISNKKDVIYLFDDRKNLLAELGTKLGLWHGLSIWFTWCGLFILGVLMSSYNFQKTNTPNFVCGLLIGMAMLTLGIIGIILTVKWHRKTIANFFQKK